VSDQALDLLAAVVLEDGRRWGDAATPEQWEDARAVLDQGGVPYHFLTRARGYSKTFDLASIALAAMLTQLPAASRLYGLAADRDQGRLLIDSIASVAARTPELAGALTVDAFKATSRSGSALEVLAADVAGSYGLRPAFLIVDELAQWSDTAGPRGLWQATTSAMAKVAESRLVALTSAGAPEHFAYAILEHALGDPLWRVNQVVGPPPWADRARLGEQRRRLPESVYRRLFQNEWSSSEGALATLDDLRACVRLSGVLEPRERLSYVIGVDLGLKHDRSVAAVCHSEDGVVVLDRMEVWAGKRLRPVNLGQVEGWLFRASRDYAFARVVCDPWQAQGMIQRLKAKGVRIEEFTFSSQSVGHLAVTLHTAIRDRRLALPDDAALLDELSHVQLRETSPGVLRMNHSAGRHDDRAISLALAAQQLISHGPGQGAVFLKLYEDEIAGRGVRSGGVEAPTVGVLPAGADCPNGCGMGWGRCSAAEEACRGRCGSRRLRPDNEIGRDC
jgi:hypothetical protein